MNKLQDVFTHSTAVETSADRIAALNPLYTSDTYS